MEKQKKNLVITGANKGLGLSIIENLFRNKNTGYKILMGTRSLKNGQTTLKCLQEKYDKSLTDLITVVQLDICDEKSIENFVELVKKDFNGKITCLVNNAGTTVPTDEFNTRVFDITYETNYYKTVSFTKKVLNENLITKSGKIVFVGSTGGQTKYLVSEKLKERFRSKDLTEEKINELALEFRTAIEKNTWEKDGWNENTYGNSKICINKYAEVLGRQKSILDNEIQVYACCPGWVRTDMGGPDAERSPEEGSMCPTYLVNLEYKLNPEFQGKFFYDEKLFEI